MLDVHLTLTKKEARLLCSRLEYATDEGDGRDQWKSEVLKLLVAKELCAVGLAEQLGEQK